MKNFTIIGTGFVMPRHVDAINSIGGKVIDFVNTAHGDNEWRKAVKDPRVDCVVVLTPNDLHYEIAKFSSENGKTVLCEKPLAINSKDAEAIADSSNIFTVLQLRHHFLAKQLEEQVKEKKDNQIEMNISVHRDKKYYECWKGQKERSGGIVFNLGIHYFDLLLHLFGEAQAVTTSLIEDKVVKGTIEGENYVCRWRLSTDEKRDNQCRLFKVNGVDYNFSSKDNLSYENLHKYVYEDLLNKKGVLPKDILPSIRLVERIYNEK